MKKFKHTISDLGLMIKPFWRYDKAYVIIRTIWNCINSPLISVLYILMTQTVINLITLGEGWQTVLGSIAAFGAVGLFTSYGGNILWKFYITLHAERVKAKIETDVFLTLKKTDYQYFDTPEFYDEFAVTYADYAKRSEEAVGYISNVFGNLASIGALFTMVCSVNIWLIILTALTAVYESVLLIKQNKLAVERDDKTSKLNRTVEYCHEQLVSRDTAMDMKCTGMSELFIKRFCRAVEERIRVNRRMDKKVLVWDSVQELLGSLADFLLRGTTALVILAGRVGVGSFVATISAADQLAWKVRSMTDIFSRINRYALDGKRIRHFLSLSSPIERADNPKENGMSDSFSLEFKNVDFTYPGSQFALKNINMKIQSGMKIAIVGENGGGKTTLTKLLLRLYDPGDGEITVNGKPLTDYNVKELRSNIGAAFQEVPIYSLTLRENLSAYRNITDTDFQKICKKMPLIDNVLKKNNANCDSELTRRFDEKGIILSGGEKQVIATSRVMSKPFKLLIFDEPTAALDPLAADMMSKAILDRSNPSAVLFISHRLSNVVDADYIYVFKNGKIIEEGTHNSLMKQSGMYYSMFLSQAQKYKEGLSDDTQETD